MMTTIAITGASGFVATNLRIRFNEQGYNDLRLISHDDDEQVMCEKLSGVDIVFHLAGVNRPEHPTGFQTGNAGFTEQLCNILGTHAPKAAIVYSSSTQAALENPYGLSKKAAEETLIHHGQTCGADVCIFRFTNIFGKWSRPNYNSAVATFCYNVARDLPITIHNPDAPIDLIYIDDAITALFDQIDPATRTTGHVEPEPVYHSTVGDVAQLIQAFRSSRETLETERVGTGLVRALYSTYVAALPPERFSYTVPMYTDPRGTFAEILKTPDCGQFSFFSAHPGVTRGEHYHHSKTEKFVVISGTAEFRFRHIETGEIHSIVTSGSKVEIVETVPGWAHNITNIGDDTMTVMLWANELFDRNRPDTFAQKV
jgi:UDP-2-acetamido-2,6-beta-L-arabino-hexul-4-ose reductase